MKAVVTMTITIDNDACEAAGITGEDVIKKMLKVVNNPLYNGISLVTNGPEGQEYDRFIVDGYVNTAIRTREGRKKKPEAEMAENVTDKPVQQPDPEIGENDGSLHKM